MSFSDFTVVDWLIFHITACIGGLCLGQLLWWYVVGPWWEKCDRRSS